jgi:outer membrane protein OmpA-like peptidoglycan-associated protein
MGGRLYNEALSIRRAQTVADALSVLGVAPQRITVNWAGERAPEVVGHTPEARSRNRRVIMTIVK